MDELVLVSQILQRSAPELLHSDYLSRRDVSRELRMFDRVYAICVGKCANRSAAGTSLAIGGRLEAGLVIDDEVGNYPFPLPVTFQHITGDHPLPSIGSYRAAEAVKQTVRKWELTPKDLVIVSISGGTSSMISSPIESLEIEDLERINAILLRSGQDVSAINSVRRRVSELHDGGLAEILIPGNVWTLLQSDNAQGDATAVGSGPTLASARPIADTAVKALKKADSVLCERVLSAIAEAPIKRLTSGQVVELSNIASLAKDCRSTLEANGFRVSLLPFPTDGSSEKIENTFRSVIEADSGSEPVAYVMCGEAAISVPEVGNPVGGRCQHVALTLLPIVASVLDSTLICYATDGRDCLENIHGALITDQLARHIQTESDINKALSTGTSYTVLNSAGALILGERTGQNLCDIYMILRGWSRAAHQESV